MLKKVFILFLICSQIACAADKKSSSSDPIIYYPEHEKVISKDEANNLISLYNNTNVVLSPDFSKINLEWHSEKVLYKISTWFTEGRGLSHPKKISEDVQLYILAPLPAELLKELDNNLKELPNTRLAILKPSFWKLIEITQKQGTTIGFLSATSKISALGVYFNTLNIIGLSPVAEENTLVHELQHRKQYQSLKPELSTSVISSACLKVSSTAFGEINATQIELPSYLGIENYLDLAMSKAGTEEWIPGTGLTALTAEPTLLNINLEYPVTVVGKVLAETECPTEIQTLMQNLNRYFLKSAQELNQSLMEVTKNVIQMNLLQINFKKNKCNHESSDKCDRINKNIDTINLQFPNRKDEFKKRLENEIAERIRYISDSAQLLPKKMALDLCAKAIGFSSYYSCGGKNE